MENINYINVFLISLLYFWGSNTALSFGIGYYTLYRPIISGMITGLILGDFKLGIMAGAVVNIIYIDFVSTGGSLKGDQCLTAIIAAVCAILFRLSPIQSAAFSYAFGYIGILIWKYRLNINSIFVRKYDEKYKEGKNPNITIYNGVLPQILLYFMSSLVMLISLFLIFLFKDIVKFHIIQNILFLFGIYLISLSVINVLLKVKNKKGNFIFLISLFLATIFNFSYVFIILLLMILFLIISYKDFYIEKNSYLKNKENRLLNKWDLIYSWFIWMNFSHACYNFERLQGMAFAQSIKNIINKLYKDKINASEIIYRHTEFFNTEPNIGTSIHGYIISLEEEIILGKESVDISYIKKGMMGFAAGMGDSFTQVVLTPFYVSSALLLCLDNSYHLSLLAVISLGINILYISYTGFMQGYYLGRDSLIKRLNIIKNSVIKKYFPLVFDGILGACVGKLILLNKLYQEVNLIYFIFALILSVIYIWIAKNKGKILRRS
ncbi:MAG: hypothetical protein K0Q97_2178 [Bacillota bacterium]|jgi:PTS system mannose-specific IID component|nr:hypothetical protein [Bacillota bacterium]